MGTIDYSTTVMKRKRLDHFIVGFYYRFEFMDHFTTIGNPLAIHRFYALQDTYMYYFSQRHYLAYYYKYIVQLKQIVDEILDKWKNATKIM